MRIPKKFILVFPQDAVDVSEGAPYKSLNEAEDDWDLKYPGVRVIRVTAWEPVENKK